MFVAYLVQVPFFFVGMLSKEWSAMANAIACGVMLAASFDLVHEAQPYGAGLAILGVVLGALRASSAGCREVHALHPPCSPLQSVPKDEC
jgi:hypothetical protein